MEDLDMSGVDPLRWAEVRRRVAVIKEFLKIRKPSDLDRKLHADQLDLSTSQFLALVRAWREYGRASAISGSGKEKGLRRRTGPRHLATEVKDAARAVVAQLDRSTTVEKAHTIVTEALVAKGLKAPSRSTVWHLLRAERQNPAEAPDDSQLLVSRCWLRLPTQMEDGIDYPSIILAVRPGSGIVLAASMATDATAGERIAAKISDLAPNDHVRVENPLAPAFKRLQREATPILSFNGRRELAKAIGNGFGNLRIIYQPVLAADAAGTLGSKDSALGPEDARMAALAAINLHNRARGAADCAWVD